MLFESSLSLEGYGGLSNAVEGKSALFVISVFAILNILFFDSIPYWDESIQFINGN
jgi:hypothetical protein